MAVINRIELKDFLVFKGEFFVDFCPGVNVLIGGNGTGKTTLLKTAYYSYCLFRGLSKENVQGNMAYFTNVNSDIDPKIFSDANGHSNIKEIKYNKFALYFDLSQNDYLKLSQENQLQIEISALYIPEKDILEHAKGLLPFIEQKTTGFGQIYKDVLIQAQDIPTKNQTETQKKIGEMIVDIVGGIIQWEQSEGMFYTIRKDGMRIPFAYEASGYKKLGYLGLLIASGQIREGSVLFWDEPENSLNPEFVPKLVDILLELSRNGVQIFLATHDYNLARYFDVRKDKNIPVAFHNLTKSGERIVCNSSSEYIQLPDNLLEKASADLFDAVVDAALEVQDNV